MTALGWTAAILFAYLIGSIPFGVLVARRRGIDIRQAGSRNIGATNVSRVLGRGYGALVFLLDVLKGLVPTAAVGVILRGGPPLDAGQFSAWLAVGAAAVTGHVCPLYLRFKGGKGVATSLGATLGLHPYLTLPCAVAVTVWIGLVLATRRVSVGSLGAALALAATLAWERGRGDWAAEWPMVVYGVALASAVWIRHRENLRRLCSGTEPRIGAPRH